MEVPFRRQSQRPSGSNGFIPPTWWSYASDHEEGYRADQILNDLAEKHPGRYILIRPAADTSRGPPAPLHSGPLLVRGGKEKRVCCDIIKLVAQREVIENLYGFTFSLLMPDLPVEFWWPGNLPYQNVFFDKMAEQSGRVWVDSSKFKDPIQSLSRLCVFLAQPLSPYPAGGLELDPYSALAVPDRRVVRRGMVKIFEGCQKGQHCLRRKNIPHPEFFPGLLAGFPIGMEIQGQEDQRHSRFN